MEDAERDDLLRQIRRLGQKLARAESNLRRLEDQRESSVIMHAAVIRELAASHDALQRQHDHLLAIQAQLERSERLATEASRAKSMFLANMSHELRTPLNAILGYAELFEEIVGERHPGLALTELHYIQAAGRQLLALIDQVLDLSRVEAGRMELETSDVGLGELVDGLVLMIGPAAARKGLDLRVTAAASGSLRTDRQKLVQVLLNLLSNAVKFTASGWVELVVEERGDAVRFAVADSGVGMTSEQQARVFQPFEQADPSTTRRFGGTGLGLAIADRFCALLGGHLSLESSPGTGTRFEFTLPR